MSSKLGVMSAGRVALCGVLLLSLEATAHDKEKFAQAQEVLRVFRVR